MHYFLWVSFFIFTAFRKAAPGAVSATTTSAAFLFVSYHSEDCKADGYCKDCQNNNVGNVHKTSLTLKQQCYKVDNHGKEPGNKTLPENHSHSPFVTQLAFDGSNGGNAGRVKEREYKEGEGCFY